MDYIIGQNVIHKSRGICKIENIGKIPFSPVKNELYYTLRPIFTNCNEYIYVPIHSINLRTAINDQEAAFYLKQLQNTAVSPCNSSKISLLTEHYRELLQNFNITSNLQLFKELYFKEKRTKENKRRLNETDRIFKNRVEQLLSEEFATALNETPTCSKKRLYEALQ